MAGCRLCMIRCEEEREARAAVIAEGDELAVEHEP
jgi:hypothetical protein